MMRNWLSPNTRSVSIPAIYLLSIAVNISFSHVLARKELIELVAEYKTREFDEDIRAVANLGGKFIRYWAHPSNIWFVLL